MFKEPDALMKNVVSVTDYLHKEVIAAGGDPERESLYVFFTKDNKPYYIDSEGSFWRCYNYIYDAHSCQCVDCPETFYNAAKAFGKFQRMLADYPIDDLTETIPNFHNTVSRFADFKKAVADNLSGRADDARSEIDFVLSREADCSVLVDLLNAGELPLRVTHNDTKLNNVMFDNKTDEGICVVDLDTVMPGLSLYDFGDSIRFGANTAAEDEKLPLHRRREPDEERDRVSLVLGKADDARMRYALSRRLHQRRCLLQDRLPRAQPCEVTHPVQARGGDREAL